MGMHRGRSACLGIRHHPEPISVLAFCWYWAKECKDTSCGVIATALELPGLLASFANRLRKVWGTIASPFSPNLSWLIRGTLILLAGLPHNAFYIDTNERCATVSAPSSFVSRAIFCVSITSPVTR